MNLLKWLVASKRELNDWFSNWWKFLDQFRLEQVQVGKFLLIQSVFGKVSNLFQDLTLTLSG